MTNTRKKAAATAAAVALGALLVLGGATMAWLQDSTKVTTNTFATNSNDVELTESNTSFDIVPGTSEVKDPTVTATYTLDSYVYVVVYDNTQDLVEWEMDSSWIELTDTDGVQVTTDDGGLVYYQVLTYEGEGEAASFSDTVIEGSVVSYSSSLTNADMNVEEDVTLAFQAYIMQAEIVTDVTGTAYAAWLIMNNTDSDDGTLPAGYVIDENTGVLYTSFAEALSNADDGDTLLLLADTAVSEYPSLTDDLIIDLGGNTLSLNNTSYAMLVSDSDVTLANGDVELVASIYTMNDGTITLENATVSTTAASAAAFYMKDGTLTIDTDSSVEASSYITIAVDTQATDSEVTLNVYGSVTTTSYAAAISSNYYTSGTDTINIYEGATVSSYAYGIYHPQSGTLNVYGGTISGYTGIQMAGGTLNMSGGTILGTANDTQLSDYYSSNGNCDGSAFIVSPDKTGVTVNISGGRVKSYYSYAIRGCGVSSSSVGTTNNNSITLSGSAVLEGALGDGNTPAYVYIPTTAPYSGYFTVTDNR